MKKPTWLLDCKEDVYSQQGEDGIISKILEIIPKSDNWCVEFGAWDGLFLTNTRNLIESKGANAVLIEADKGRFDMLRNNYKKYSNVTTINEFVGFEEKDSLDSILRATSIPNDFDLLSIDIDGNDFHVWNAMSVYKPKVVVIEFNPTIPSHIDFVQPKDPIVQQGASLRSLVELGKKKGYELISALPCNAFFVKKEFYSLFEIELNSPEALNIDNNAVTYIFSGYDGQVFLHGNCKLPWHDIDIKESKLQPLPYILRKFPGNYSLFHKIIFGLYCLINDRDRLRREIKFRKNRNLEH
jgi:hypothetical protein